MDKVVVTMTSWTQRIATVHFVIKQFLENQTVKPDIFYLWLSEEEFPRHEQDIPLELAKLEWQIQLKWLPGNDNVFKRWSVYPQHFDDYVLCIDDDSLHSPFLIEDCLDRCQQNSNNVICNVWRQFSAVPTYQNDIKIQWKYIQDEVSQLIWPCGTKMIPPKAFPLEALEPDAIEWKNTCFPKNDEVWLIPFFLKNSIKVSYPKRGFQYMTIQNESETALAKNINMKAGISGYKPAEVQLYKFLKHLGLYELYKKTFIGYDDSQYLRAVNGQ